MAGNMRDEPGACYSIKKQERVKRNDGAMPQEHGNQLKELPISKVGTI